MKQPETDDPARGAVRAIAAGLARAQDAAGCPDPTELAAFAEGSLGRPQRGPVEAHLALCSDCRSVVATLLQAAPAIVRQGRPAPTTWWLAAAAGLLAALGAIFWPREDPALVRQLETAAVDLRRSAPDLFGDFALLSDAELAERPAVVRGEDGLLWIHPSGTGLLRDPRPALVFDGTGAGAMTFRLEVEDPADGTPLGAAEGRLVPAGPRLAAEWPLTIALRQGLSSKLRLVVQTPAGERNLERIVTAAPADAVAAYDRSVAALERHHRDDLGPALQAHLALRARFLREAEQAVLAFRARLPAEPAGAVLQRYVRAKLGLPDQE